MFYLYIPKNQHKTTNKQNKPMTKILLVLYFVYTISNNKKTNYNVTNEKCKPLCAPVQNNFPVGLGQGIPYLRARQKNPNPLLNEYNNHFNYMTTTLCVIEDNNKKDDLVDEICKSGSTGSNDQTNSLIFGTQNRKIAKGSIMSSVMANKIIQRQLDTELKSKVNEKTKNNQICKLIKWLSDIENQNKIDRKKIESIKKAKVDLFRINNITKINCNTSEKRNEIDFDKNSANDVFLYKFSFVKTYTPLVTKYQTEYPSENDDSELETNSYRSSIDSENLEAFPLDTNNKGLQRYDTLYKLITTTITTEIPSNSTVYIIDKPITQYETITETLVKTIVRNINGSQISCSTNIDKPTQTTSEPISQTSKKVKTLGPSFNSESVSNFPTEEIGSKRITCTTEQHSDDVNHKIYSNPEEYNNYGDKVRQKSIIQPELENVSNYKQENNQSNKLEVTTMEKNPECEATSKQSGNEEEDLTLDPTDEISRPGSSKFDTNTLEEQNNDKKQTNKKKIKKQSQINSDDSQKIMKERCAACSKTITKRVGDCFPTKDNDQESSSSNESKNKYQQAVQTKNTESSKENIFYSIYTKYIGKNTSSSSTSAKDTTAADNTKTFAEPIVSETNNKSTTTESSSKITERDEEVFRDIAKIKKLLGQQKKGSKKQKAEFFEFGKCVLEMLEKNQKTCEGIPTIIEKLDKIEKAQAFSREKEQKRPEAAKLSDSDSNPIDLDMQNQSDDLFNLKESSDLVKSMDANTKAEFYPDNIPASNKSDIEESKSHAAKSSEQDKSENNNESSSEEHISEDIKSPTGEKPNANDSEIEPIFINDLETILHEYDLSDTSNQTQHTETEDTLPGPEGIVSVYQTITVTVRPDSRTTSTESNFTSSTKSTTTIHKTVTVTIEDQQHVENKKDNNTKNENNLNGPVKKDKNQNKSYFDSLIDKSKKFLSNFNMNEPIGISTKIITEILSQEKVNSSTTTSDKNISKDSNITEKFTVTFTTTAKESNDKWSHSISEIFSYFDMLKHNNNTEGKPEESSTSSSTEDSKRNHAASSEIFSHSDMSNQKNNTGDISQQGSLQSSTNISKITNENSTHSTNVQSDTKRENKKQSFTDTRKTSDQTTKTEILKSLSCGTLVMSSKNSIEAEAETSDTQKYEDNKHQTNETAEATHTTLKESSGSSKVENFTDTQSLKSHDIEYTPVYSSTNETNDKDTKTTNLQLANTAETTSINQNSKNTKIKDLKKKKTITQTHFVYASQPVSI